MKATLCEFLSGRGLLFPVVLALLALAPPRALAQEPDSVHVEVAGVEHPAYGAAFGPPFPADMPFGPLPLVQVEGNGETAPPEQGCDPLVNGDEVAGTIAIIARGTCPFDTKVLHAQEAGAAAVVVHNDDRGPGGQGPIVMPGKCPSCAIPAAFITYKSWLDIRTELMSGPVDATILPIRIAPPPVAAEPLPPAAQLALYPVYPNPVRGQMAVPFRLSRASEVRVWLVDVLGRKVAVLVDGPVRAGDHMAGFDASELAAGVYIVRIRAGDVARSRRVLVVR